MRRETEARSSPEGRGGVARAWAGGKQAAVDERVGAGVKGAGWNGSLEQPHLFATRRFGGLIQALVLGRGVMR